MIGTDVVGKKPTPGGRWWVEEPYVCQCGNKGIHSLWAEFRETVSLPVCCICNTRMRWDLSRTEEKCWIWVDGEAVVFGEEIYGCED